MKRKLYTTLSLTALLTTPMLLSAADAEELWMKNCRKCHGENGAGDTAIGKKLGVMDYTDPEVQASMTDEEIKNVITNGGESDSGRSMMLAFGDKLSEEEIDTLVAYIRTMKGE